MKRTTKVAGLAAATLALVLPPLADAHVTLSPSEAPAGSYAVLNVRVPNEKEDRGTVKVEVQLPPGVSYAAYQPVPHWSTRVTMRTPAKPFSVEGAPVTAEVATITWASRTPSGAVNPGQFQQFPVSLRVPDGAEGTKLPFKALQTYEGGEVVRWIGAADAETPAPTLTLEDADDDEGGAHADVSAATAARPAKDDDGGSDAVPIALGAAGLLAGLAGLAIALAGRRRRA